MADHIEVKFILRIHGIMNKQTVALNHGQLELFFVLGPDDILIQRKRAGFFCPVDVIVNKLSFLTYDKIASSQIRGLLPISFGFENIPFPGQLLHVNCVLLVAGTTYS